MAVEALPGFPGAYSVPFSGETHDYNVYILSSRDRNYPDWRDNLVAAVTTLKAKIFSQDPRFTETFVQREVINLEQFRGTGTSQEEIEKRGTYMLAVDRADPTRIVGVLTARELAVNTFYSPKGYMDVLLQTRAVDLEFTDDNLGYFLAREVVSRHVEAEINAIKTQNAVAYWSDVEAQFFGEETAFPFARRYNTDPLAHDVCRNLDARTKRRATIDSPHDITGVVRREYGRRLVEFKPKEGHIKTQQYQAQMEDPDIEHGGLDMHIDEGDAVHIMDYTQNYREEAA